ncbi:MAG: methyl-accepting chemotaxis protein [Campylobacterota bacterium]|nr:methyl-accepting chemotaxis protein [Campylobacterota bacterium]
MQNKFRVSTKIIIPIIFILTIGNIITNYITVNQMSSLSKNNAKDSLNMLTDSIFLTLRNAMNTGDPVTIKKAEDESRDNIKGLTSLNVAKSKETIEMYSPSTTFTKDSDILHTFETKEEQVLEIYKNDSHFLRVIRPMVATPECLMCHANQKDGDVIGVIDLTFSLDTSDTIISKTLYFILSISVIFIVITIFTVWFVSKKATNPLHELQKELDLFFSFLANERDTIEPFKVHSHDEIGEMVISLNENITKTIIGLKKDADAIKDVSAVSLNASLGNLKVQINSKANNPEINNLISIVNNLINSLNYNINRVLKSLNDYSKDEYSIKINSSGKTTGEIKILFDKVDFLGETLTKLSSQNLKNGKALQQTSKIFSKNISILTDTSNEQAIKLSSTSEELNNINENLEETVTNSKQMSTLANTLISSSQKGHQLAINTSDSMNDINTKVNSINDAISIIEQISFQTNILSLNAAVEAATAGEAGKGFAVVAQEVRNLASRSAEAANEIKLLVENAISQASISSDITKEMIDGYEKLNENIDKTTSLIEIVSSDTNNQKQRISNINNEILEINKTTHENAKIAQETNIVAKQASAIALKIVEDAGEKKFDGKDNIKIRKKIVDPNFKGVDRRKIQ